jgi:hypothetical protein
MEQKPNILRLCQVNPVQLRNQQEVHQVYYLEVPKKRVSAFLVRQRLVDKMTVKDDRQHQEEITIETPNPQEITPPPEAIIASQTPVETNEIAIPVIVEEIITTSSAPPGSSEGPEGTPELCTVIAPSSLDEGYSFPAQVDGIDFVVTVPEGGIRQGEAFQVPYPTRSMADETNNRQLEPLEIAQSSVGPSHQVTRDSDIKGRWRKPLCECCEVCENGLWCNAFFCTPVVLAQVMMRLKLNFLGCRASGGTLYQQTFWWVVAFWVIFLVLFFALVVREVALFVVICIWTIYFTIVSTNVRSTVRRKYSINPDCSDCCDGVLDDCCISFWCSCCSTIQMIRQTHDMSKYPYQCCTKTGLNGDAPEVV